MRLRLLGVGAFREGFKIKNSDVVIKFPLIEEDGDTSVGRRHSVQEIRRIRRLRQSKVLDIFLPEVLYYDRKSGVIAMRYYPEFKNYEEQADAMGKMIQAMIYKITRVRCRDIHTENVRRGKSNNAVIIDLGF